MDWTGIKVYTAPAIEPVSLEELKTYMRLDSSSYDTMLSSYITACRDAVERHTGRTMISTTFELYLDAFPANNGYIELIHPPVQSVSSIYYNQESDGVLTLLAASLYTKDLVSLYPRIEPAYDEDWPDTRDMVNAVKITYVAGYGDTTGTVPEILKTCIKALASDLFEHPETNLEVALNENKTYKFLLASYAIPGIA